MRTIGTAAQGGWGKGPRKHPNGRRQVPNFDSAGRHEFRRPPAAAWGRRGQQNQGPAESKLGEERGKKGGRRRRKKKNGGGAKASEHRVRITSSFRLPASPPGESERGAIQVRGSKAFARGTGPHGTRRAPRRQGWGYPRPGEGDTHSGPHGEKTSCRTSQKRNYAKGPKMESLKYTQDFPGFAKNSLAKMSENVHARTCPP